MSQTSGLNLCFTEQEIKNIKQSYYQFKHKVPEIANAFGVSESSIWRILKS